MSTLLRGGLLLLLAASQPAPVDSTTHQVEPRSWQVRTARMEGAAANVRESASLLSRTASEIHESGRLAALAQLSSRALVLERRVQSAVLAAQVLDE
ncbi:MAG: hypothetical protein QGG40_09090 [Myxococcota bacterium]|nr:hypothetical protein [Myxococcota bacterium]